MSDALERWRDAGQVYRGRMRRLVPWIVASMLIAAPSFAAKPGKAQIKPVESKPAVQPEPAPTPEAPKPRAVQVLPAAAPRPEVPPTLRAHSVNLSPLGVAIGDYALNYQWMFARGHALLLELALDWSDTKDTGATYGIGGQLGYRWLWRGEQSSWFLGVLAGYDVGRTALVTTASGPDLTVKRTFHLPYSRWRATLDIGRRWVFGPGLNLTVRVGAGPGQRRFARGGGAEADRQAQAVEALVNFLPISLDSELSIGWIF